MRASKLIAKILILCGVSLTCTSCYAPPSATFELKGNVTDELGRPIEGIEVAVRPAGSEYSFFPIGKTDPAGNYAILDPNLSGGVGEFKVIAADVDGDEGGGLFAADTVTVFVSGSDYKGGYKRGRGRAAETADLELKLKSEDNYENE